MPFKDPMEDAVKVAIKTGGAETTTKKIEADDPLTQESLFSSYHG